MNVIVNGNSNTSSYAKPFDKQQKKWHKVAWDKATQWLGDRVESRNEEELDTNTNTYVRDREFFEAAIKKVEEENKLNTNQLG